MCVRCLFLCLHVIRFAEVEQARADVNRQRDLEREEERKADHIQEHAKLQVHCDQIRNELKGLLDRLRHHALTRKEALGLQRVQKELEEVRAKAQGEFGAVNASQSEWEQVHAALLRQVCF